MKNLFCFGVLLLSAMSFFSYGASRPEVLRIDLLGHRCVGRTTFIKTLNGKGFSFPAIPLETDFHIFKKSTEKTVLFIAMPYAFLSESSAVILCYSLEDRNSFTWALAKARELKRGSVPFVFLGLQNDKVDDAVRKKYRHELRGEGFSSKLHFFFSNKNRKNLERIKKTMLEYF